MILNGFKFLFSPQRTWNAIPEEQKHPVAWIITASVTVAILPSMAVVTGHLLAGWTDQVSMDIAIQRATVGFVVTTMGALVMASALALAFFHIGPMSRILIHRSNAPKAAMTIVWPVWTCGLVLVIPPLLGAPPETGDLLWLLVAIPAMWRVVRHALTDGLSIQRRWKTRFQMLTMLSFLSIFPLITILPMSTMRHLLNVEGIPTYREPTRSVWPIPPRPEW